MKKEQTLSEAFDEMFTEPTESKLKKIHKESLNDVYDKTIGDAPRKVRHYNSVQELMKGVGVSRKIQQIINRLDQAESTENELDTLYNEMLDRVEHDELIELIDELRDVPISKCNPPKKNTLVVNMFAGPGAGKSTTAAGVFFELKSRGVNCEIAAEFAKDLTWEERHNTLTDQIYIFGKQYHRISRLLGKVDVIITDSPILLTPIYDSENRKPLEELVISEHRKMWTYNVFLKRVKPFNQSGRIHGEAHAKQIDRNILGYLDDLKECYETFDGTPDGKNAIVNKIMMLLSINHNG